MWSDWRETVFRTKTPHIHPHIFPGGDHRLDDPRFMPGDPVDVLMARAGSFAESTALMHDYYTDVFGLDVPVWQQYLNFWKALLQGDLGISVYVFPAR